MARRPITVPPGGLNPVATADNGAPNANNSDAAGNTAGVTTAADTDPGHIVPPLETPPVADGQPAPILADALLAMDDVPPAPGVFNVVLGDDPNAGVPEGFFTGTPDGTTVLTGGGGAGAPSVPPAAPPSVNVNIVTPPPAGVSVPSRISKGTAAEMEAGRAALARRRQQG